MTGARGRQTADPRSLADGIARLWETFRPINLERVVVLERAVAALLAGQLDPDLRRLAEREAHKLAGGVGTYGFTEAAAAARRAEELLQGDDPIPAPAVLRLADAVVRVRHELEVGVRVPPPAPVDEDARDPTADADARDAAGGAAAADASEAADAVDADAAGPDAAGPAAGAGVVGDSAPPLLLVAGVSDEYRERLVMEAEGRGLELRLLTPDAAAFARPRSVALLDLDGLEGGASDPVIGQLRAAAPRTPIVGLSATADFGARLAAARSGVHRFVRKPAPPQEAVELALEALALEVEAGQRVLLVDDDPQVGSAARELLATRGIETVSLEDPTRFWDVLARVRPDLLVLDIAMPGVSGLDLCRVVRADPAWSELPILFLTGKTRPDILRAAFEAGADDFVAKPMVGPELVARIESRLERARLARLTAGTDPASGMRSRKEALREARRLLDIGRRHHTAVSMGWIRVREADGADARELGRLLRRSLRSTDVVGRWSAEELFAVLYGSDRSSTAQRLGELLGDRLSAPASVTVATAPDDGVDAESLYRAARTAAETEATEVVVAAGRPSGRPADRADVLVVEDDEALAGLLLHALDVAGYRTAWIEDGQDALDALAGDPPSLRARVVLLDVDLPGRDGLTVLRELARAGVLGPTRVIVVTRRSSEPEVVRALDLGAVDHVEKPFSLPILLQRVRRASAP